MSVALSSLLQFFLATVLPLLGVALTGGLVVYTVYARWIESPHKWLLTPRALAALIVIALLCDAWLGIRLYQAHRGQQVARDSAAIRASRERFVLPQDSQYGELIIPAGSLINRNDPFDKGEPDRPLSLRGLEAVRFSQPVQVAGVWASALQTLPARVELAQDQKLGPLHRYDTATQSWVRNTVIAGLACRKGQFAVFQVPHVPYDVQAEVGKPAPDGPDARFLPSQWLLRTCENGPAITVEPAYTPGTTPPAR